jgi:xylose isomerase
MDLYPYTEDAVEAVRRSVIQWRFIDGVAAKIDEKALREAQLKKDAVRAYELVYAALGA